MNQYILFYDGQHLHSGEFGGFSTGFQMKNDSEAKEYVKKYLLPGLSEQYRITHTNLYRFINLD